MNWQLRMQRLRTPWIAGWLAWALVLAPALGRMHEVLHAPTPSAAHAQTSSHHHSAGHGISAWFAGYDDLDCQVLDQLAHGLDTPPATWTAAHSLPQSRSLAPIAWHLLPTTAPVFLARAPPTRFMV